MMIRSAENSDTDAAKKEGYPAMNFTNRTKRSILCIVLALLCICSLLTSCSKLHKIKADGNGGYIDKKTGVTYYDAPACYEPFSYTEEYAKFGDSTLCCIADLDPEKWLCSPDTDAVYHSSDITLPSFEDMTIKEIKLCYEDVYTFQFAVITDADEIAEVRDVYLNGEVGVGFSTTPEKLVAVKILFEECPNIYYSFMYGCNSDGEAYISNRSERKIVVANGLFDKYIYADDGDGDDE